jgi:hypothetical protein
VESGVVFSLGLWGTAPARVEGGERGTRLGSIGIELLGSDELACGALEPCTVASKRSLSQASAALEINSRRKTSRSE